MPGKFEILTSLAELAKAGYKPSDVKDILESLKTDPDLKPNGGSDLKEKTPEDQKKKEDDPKKKTYQSLHDWLDDLFKYRLMFSEIENEFALSDRNVFSKEWILNFLRDEKKDWKLDGKEYDE